ncbi:MAG: hypothetical protein CMF39_06155 [Legionellaceae bacterium]|nr:hypothetical protein [Legionellaceae bacterium]
MRIFLTALLGILLAGCSTHWFGEQEPIHNNETTYQHSQSVPPLKMPAGVSMGEVQSAYPVPQRRPQWTGQPSLLPPGAFDQAQPPHATSTNAH